MSAARGPFAAPQQTRRPHIPTFVYVSNAADGDIGMYRLDEGGVLAPLGRVAASPLVMPMAVSPDRRFLYAASRGQPYAVHVYAIDRARGTLAPLATSPLPESFPYISLDRTGRYLFGAAYGAHLVTVNAVGEDGRVAPEPLQVVPVGRNAHSIRVDESNRYAYVPTLRSDAVFQFRFDARRGTLASNTPAVVMLPELTGPRHFVTSPDNRFVYVLGELRATVTTLALDPQTGTLTEIACASALAPDSTLRPGLPRTPVAASVDAQPPRDRSQDIWAADLHVTPDGRYVYVSERTGSTIGAFSADAATGVLTYLGTAATETQPRGFAIDPAGRYLVVSGERSDLLSVYAIDDATGALQRIGRYPTGKGSNWVEIVAFEHERPGMMDTP